MKLIPIAIFALLSSAVAQTAMHEAQHAAGSQEATVSLCELIAHPSAYAGKPVTVKATLASGMEFSIFTDDSCQPAPDKTKLILAKFSSNQFESPMGKKLSKLLKEKQRAEVTMVGVFTDPGRFVGHQACCRYKLEVRQLLAVEEATAATPDKHGSAGLETVGPEGWDSAPENPNPGGLGRRGGMFHPVVFSPQRGFDPLSCTCKIQASGRKFV
jgi:hypothetical protein